MFRVARTEAGPLAKRVYETCLKYNSESASAYICDTNTHIQTSVHIGEQVYAHAVAVAHMCLMYGQTVQVVDDFSWFCCCKHGMRRCDERERERIHTRIREYEAS